MKITARPLLISLGYLCAAFLISIVVGSVFIPPATLLDLITSALRGESSPFDPNGSFSTILFQLRLPRTVLLLLVGASLAGSGSAYQGLFRNPLADPFLIGVASGAGMGAVIAMTIQWPYTPLGLLAVPLAAFIGALLAVLVVSQLARVGKTIPTTNLILAGVSVSAFSSAVSSLLMINSSGELRRAIVWLMGGSTMTGWGPVLGVLPYAAIGLTALLLLGHPLNVLQFGDEQAQQLGVPVQKVRRIVIVAATLVTAAAVAFAGVIGFVGLVVPHIVRILWGGDYRRLLPLSMICGAGLLLITDVAARTIIAPQEIPVGIITALMGAPFFLWVLKRSKSQNYW
ncbi:MAG: iron complex transport system permease protein [Chloroflexi bacterium]|nr:MAG: iron complex transport system permease protein [Chloroflexota bacterium]MBA4374950.1 iron ABC transporter [Anaerolinea sp.]